MSSAVQSNTCLADFIFAGLKIEALDIILDVPRGVDNETAARDLTREGERNRGWKAAC
ncbi:hypothetical protein DPMN_114063 [Dreissena polymorpha]|uniref:Uncharacterized protein n=1 Tax=Dreissena polymorpha TaxID=45954 RepID=A0A9D4KK60_DREPO|nr:hypothetical protein DPMN_114063 [Dreissena polymorpha]